MTSPASIRRCVIVGAGLAGLAAARTLHQAGVTVVVLDKARGVGGRMATRRVDDAVFDHGAQFFTVRTDAFAAEVRRWIDAGVAVEWSEGFAADDPAGEHGSRQRFRGHPSMTAIPKFLAMELDVRLGTRAVELNEWDGGWEVVVEQGDAVHADAVILTPPVPQTLDLLRESRIPMSAECDAVIRAIRYESTFAVMAVLEGPSTIPGDGLLRLAGEPIAWIADNHRKGISPRRHSVTIQAGAAFSSDRLDADTQETARILLASASEWLGARVTHFEIHRWRYSVPVNNVGAPCMGVPDVPPLVLAGDAFGAARIEGAWLSGMAAARAILDGDPPIPESNNGSPHASL